MNTNQTTLPEYSHNFTVTNSSELVGGTQEKWNQMITQVGQTIEQPYLASGGQDMSSLNYDITHLNRMDCPLQLNPHTATFNNIAIHALLRQRLKPSTIDKHLRYARFMENHVVPVDFRNPNYTNFIRHMDYREQIEQVGQSALFHEWKTMKMFLKAYGIPLTNWSYRPPPCPQAKARIIPHPNIVHKIEHHKYSNGEYENALIQYTLMHTFMIGWRNPSETCIMTVDNVKLDEGILVITEPKKSGSTRVIMPEKPLMKRVTRKSFKNWMERWRPKAENQHSGNALYLQLYGRPIEISQYRMFITRHV
jgi:hypothetical protein